MFFYVTFFAISWKRPGELSILSTVYFFGSFGFLVGRTVAVTLLAARINDQSRLALPALYNCPGPTYDIEVITIFLFIISTV